MASIFTAYMLPLIAWSVSLALILGLPLVGLWLLASALPGAIPLPEILSTNLDRFLVAIGMAPEQLAGIPLPEPGMVLALAKLLTLFSAGFLLLMLLSYAVSPLRRLIRAQGTVAKVEKKTNLHRRLAQVATGCHQKMPALWLIDSQAINACAMAAPGRRQAILLTTGLVQSVTSGELRWVFAHELAHLRYGDAAGTGLWLASQQWRISAHRLRAQILDQTLRATYRTPLAFVIAPPLALICRLTVTAVNMVEALALKLIILVRRAGNRRAEFRADAYAATHVGALPGQALLQRLATGGRIPLSDLVGTHPSASQRIQRLQAAATPKETGKTRV